eukprot:TRINITY_DN59878_c0_g1_i1.p1 TRINITY_DN59878_c0_g1~~TRINITY_DN59878_c0_g1_i1.p1  ORF type:complete len:684 (+),score=-20.95 TRINITY_DN59878_c0_g1_i1:88-2139(+)
MQFLLSKLNISSKKIFNHNKSKFYSTSKNTLNTLYSIPKKQQWSNYLPFITAFTICTLFHNQADNCGIVGVVGTDDSSQFLVEGLYVLRNRGYDSAGMASINKDGELMVSKYASLNTTSDSIDRLKADSHFHYGTSTGIAHTRWATHGGRTDENAHPHQDYKHRIALIHNGTINNSHELKAKLKKDGIKFTSETDTEVIAHLVGQQLDKGLDTKEAVTHALAQCDGSWGLAVINKEKPDEIVAACNGSPMVIGIGDSGKTYIASETTAFSKYTKNFISMKDGEIGVITPTSTSLDKARIEQAPDHEISLTPHPYPHFTIKELLQQPESIARALSFGARMSDNRIVLGGLDVNKEKMSNIHNMILTACGTSKYASEFGAKIMRDLESFDTVSVLDSAEVRRCDVPKTNGGILAVSQSGETKDVVRAVRMSLEENVPCLSVVNNVGSLIARTTGIGVYLNAGRENAVASTKAFTSQVTVLTLVALWFRQLKEDNEKLAESPLKKQFRDSLQRLPISFGTAFQLHDKCKQIAKELDTKHSVFLLGKGYGEPIALEGALKLKEIGYIHAEGCSGGALKHGPFALIEGPEGKFGSTPVICIILDDEHAALMHTVAEEVKARGAKVYVITDNPKLAANIDEDPIIIPNNGMLTALIAVLPLQLIAYELALLRGINPDVPRNLAKAVTVD